MELPLRENCENRIMQLRTRLIAVEGSADMASSTRSACTVRAARTLTFVQAARLGCRFVKIS